MGSKFALMVNSGSSANLLAVASLTFRSKDPLKPGDEVIVPAVSWSTTYSPLQQYGLKLVFVDINPNTLNIDLDEVSKAITPKTKAIFCVNLLGNPCNFKEIKEIIKSKNQNISLLEDNCESLGAKFKDRYAGTYGLISTQSFFYSHHISTMEGGMILTDDEELYQIMLSLRAHGWTRDLPKDNQITEPVEDPFYDKFRFILPGYNLRPLEMSGALGQEQLKKLPSLIQGRRKNAQVFIDLFKNFDFIDLQSEESYSESSWFGFAIICKDPKDRFPLMQLLESEGVEVRPIVTGNFLNNEALKYYDYRVASELNSAEHIDQCGFFIGNHHYDISQKLQSIATIFKNFKKNK
jgi:CDP-6-deoxy-D-xylo-4-hexulose-3-dehydrase